MEPWAGQGRAGEGKRPWAGQVCVGESILHCEEQEETGEGMWPRGVQEVAGVSRELCSGEGEAWEGR